MTSRPLAFLLAISATLTAQDGLDGGLLHGLRFRSIGPAGMSGRTSVVEALASDPNVIWIGTANGGVWKSINAGLTWRAVFDDQPVASIGAIAVDQRVPDVVWVGTGEGNPRNSVSVGNGIYKSLDGGRTWRHLGLADSEHIARIVLHPTDSRVAWVAVLGALWSDSEHRGVYKTEDGGATWRRVLNVDATTGCADLVIDPVNPDKLLAALWQHRRWPWSFRSGGPGSGLFRTMDGGQTWQKLGRADGMPEGDLGRIGLAIARSDPRVVYALVEAGKSALLRSDDGGFSFRAVNTTDGIAPRPFYYADLRVDAKDPQRVYSLHSIVTVSEDGGRTFRPLVGFGVHPDHHALWIHPDDPRHLIESNDGGVSISHDHGATWRFVGNLPLAQFYHVALDMDRPYHVYGGLQDNGSWRGPAEVWENGGIRNHHWQEVGFGDGFGTLPCPDDSMRGYAMSQGGFLMRWNLRNGERKSIRPPAPAPAEGADKPAVKLRFNWNAAIAQDPFDPATIWYGSQFLHRSRDRGDSWDIASPDLTTNNPAWQKQEESGGLTRDVTGAENFTTIMSIAPSAIERGLIWVGTDDGKVQLTRDGGAHWTDVSGAFTRDASAADGAGLPPTGTWIAHVEAGKHAAGTAFVCAEDHRRGNFAPYVLRTDDFGATWRNLATPAISGWCLDLEQDPVDQKLLFLGTEHGLWFSVDGGGAWHRLTGGFPTTAAMAIAVHPRDHDLIVATHGRGIFVLDDVTPLRGLSAAALRAPLHLFAPPAAFQYRVRQTDGSRFPGDGEFRGENPPYGARITFAVAGDDLPLPDPRRERERATPGKARKATVEVRDAAGQRVRRFKIDVTQGINRVTWGLERDGVRGPARGQAPTPPAPDEDLPGGRQVLPGTYTVAVSIDGRDGEQTAELRVLADPRAFVERADRDAKDRELQRVEDHTRTLFRVGERISQTRRDVDAVLARVPRPATRAGPGTQSAPASAPADRHQPLRAAGDAVTREIKALEQTLFGPEDRQGIRGEETTTGKLSRASGALGSSWDPPTPGELRLVADAAAAVEAAVRKLDEILSGPVARFRERAQEARVDLLPDATPFTR